LSNRKGVSFESSKLPLGERPAAAAPSSASGNGQATSWGDIVFRWLCQGAGSLVLLVVAGLITVLIAESWPVLTRMFQYKLLTSSDWNPDAQPPVFGSLVFVFGTLATSLIAMLIAVPLGIGSAAYLSEIAPAWIRRICSFLIELLAAIPSVVYGFWGLFFVAPVVRKFFELVGGPNTAAGQGILSAGLILAIMIFPYITAISFDVCRAVPRSQREGSLVLGATRWQMIWTVVLPYARPGIVAACFLALGRALGETMAVTMLIGNVHFLDFSLFATGDSIASIIANQLNEAEPLRKRPALVALGFLLFIITAVTNLVARFLIARAARPPKPRLERDLGAISLTEEVSLEKFSESESHRRSTRFFNSLMTTVLAACQLFTIVPLFLILGYIMWRGAAAIDWNFFTQRAKPPGEPGGGLAHSLLGSAEMVFIASAFAVPFGILTAIFLTEYKEHRLTRPIRFFSELLGGVPSIVIGIFGYAVLVKPFWMDGPLLGFSAWAGIFALGVLMLPIVIRTSEESIKLVPGSLRQASYALGARQWQTVLRVILPASLPAIITGILLAMGRIAGETAPLILTAHGSNYWPNSLSAPTPFLPGYIFDFSKSPDSEERRLAWAGAAVLLGVIMVLNVVVRLLAGRRVIAASEAD